MEEITLRQIKEQIDLYVGEQLKQIRQKLIESLPKEVDWQLEEQVRQISRKIWQKTVLGDNHQNWFNEDGYLINPEDWSIAVAEYIAMEEGVPMTDAHWEVINFMREYYEEYYILPSSPFQIIKLIIKKFGMEKDYAKKHLYELFPGAPARLLWKIVGLRPPHWPPGVI